MLRRKPRQPGPSASTATAMAPVETEGPGHRADVVVTRLEAMLVAEPNAPRIPVLSESEALVVVELLEHMMRQPIDQRRADLARTVIVRILDRLEHPPPGASPT